jgi:hypothetical protein
MYNAPVHSWQFIEGVGRNGNLLNTGLLVSSQYRTQGANLYMFSAHPNGLLLYLWR